MKKIFVIIIFLTACALIIGAAIKSGKHHADCRECKIVCKESIGMKQE